jgi:hypothetical protein
VVMTPAHWKFSDCQNASAAVAGNDRKPRDVRRASVVSGSLPERERDDANGEY